jgi:hypothetical protein
MFLFTTIDRADTVQSALNYASSSTGVDFDYLLATAQRESNLDPNAKARTSTASGLFQFIESTWLATLKEAGPRHGYGKLAEQIQPTQRGGFTVPDPNARQEILALRHDPKAAALMAGEFTRKNGESLERAIGREPTTGELYIAHFLGARGAAELMRLVQTAPQSPAAENFPAAARANRPIFYTGDGHPRSAREVYANLVARHGAGQPPDGSRQQGDAALAYTRQDDRVDRIFHGMFSDAPGTSQAAGLGPIAQNVRSFWSGLFTTPAAPAADGGEVSAPTGTVASTELPSDRTASVAGTDTPASGASSDPWRWEDPSLPVRPNPPIRGLW